MSHAPTINWRRTICVAASVAAVLLGSCSKSSDTKGKADEPARSTTTTAVASRSNEELALAWWSWAASRPAAASPIADATGEHCDESQPKDVWFLAGTSGGAATRTCTIPAGRPVFFPVLNVVCGPTDGCDTLLNGAKTSATLDGNSVEIVPVTSTGPVTAVSGNGNDLEPGTHTMLSSGQWVRLQALAPGTHQLRFSGATGSFSLDVTYNLSVA